MTHKRTWLVHKSGTITEFTKIKEEFKDIAIKCEENCDWIDSIMVVGDHDWDPHNVHYFYFQEKIDVIKELSKKFLIPKEIYIDHPFNKIIKAIDGRPISLGFKDA